MMSRKTLLAGLAPLISICSTICFNYAFGQSSDYNFLNLSIRDGLSSNVVKTIMKDRYGYMWFGTDDGLNKFDGVHFSVYRHTRGDSTSIGANSIEALCQDKEGNFWIGTETVLSRYDRKKDAFTNYNFTRFTSIRSLSTDHLGNVWVGGYGGLFCFDPKTEKLKHYEAGTPEKPGKLASNTILAVFEDSRERLWIGTAMGLHLYDRNRDTFTVFTHNNSDSNSIPDNIIRDLTEDLNGNLWVATTDGGLSCLRADGKSFSNYKHEPGNSNSLSSNRIYCIKTDCEGKIWLGTEEGLNILDPYTKKISRIENSNRNPHSFKGRSIRSIYIDKNGIYWIGTLNAGINKFDKNLSFFNLVESNANDPQGLTYPFVTAFAEGENGRIYLGTEGGGLQLFDPATGRVEHPVLDSDRYKNVHLTILALERSGEYLYVGTFQDGLYKLNLKTGRVDHFLQGEGEQTISGNDIFCLTSDSKGHVWIGTNGQGINVYDPRTNSFKRWTRKEAEKKGFGFASTGFIRSIVEDRKGDIWIGTIGVGVGVYSISGDSCRMLNRWSSRLPVDKVTSIFCQQDGTICVGTPGGGLSIYNEKEKKFENYGEQEGLANGFVYKILEDSRGKIWLSTNTGISCFDKKSKLFVNYSHHYGLQESSFSQGAGLRSSNGYLFFGGHEGFNYFDPLKIKGNKIVPALVFTGIKVDNMSVMPGKDAAISENISTATVIQLNYRQNFSLDFAALNYTSPQENRYMYKLDGFDVKWNDAGENHSAVYTNLDPGKYTFRVKARSSTGSWVAEEKIIRISVKPPLWRTDLAYLVYILALCFIVFYVRYRGIRRVRIKFALQQERQKARQMVEDERKEAERKLAFNQQRVKFLTNLSHEFRTPVSLIISPLDKLLQSEPSKERALQLGMVQRNARRLLNMVNQLLDFRKLEESELRLNIKEGDFVRFLSDICSSFDDVASQKNIDFSFQCNIDSYYTAFDADKVERILFNLISNAFKFTPKNGKIELTLSSESASALKITCADSGIGISKEIQEKIFDQFYQADLHSGILNQGTGVGLSIAREFARLHGGSLSVESELGEGSTFTLELPLRQLEAPCETLPDICDAFMTSPGTGIMEEIPENEKLTVLLVDDNDDFRQYLEESLKPFYKMVIASDGKEGWQKALSAHPKVIVTDINMPEMDGISLAKKIRSDKRTRHIPIILLTALTGDHEHLKGLQTGANDYLTKPFNFDILNVKIKNLVSLNKELEQTYSKHVRVDLPAVPVESEDEKLLLKITEFIQSNIDSQTLSVEELSRQAFMSRGSLYSKILSLTGETPVEYIRTVKLARAIELLEKSDLKISEIGYAVGFSSPNYFAKAFKTKFHISPSDYLHRVRKADKKSFPAAEGDLSVQD